MGKKGRFVPVEDVSDDDDFGEDDEAMSDEDSEMEDIEDEGEEEAGQPGTAGHGQKKAKKGSQRPEREPLYDVEGLHEKLEDIGWTDGVPWDETQVISHDDPAQVENVDDDIARELGFYNQALSAAQQAIVRFDAAGVPWLRPQDYYAEMVKSDQHMAKVKEQLMFEQRAIEQSEERRKAREAKQYSKQVQAEKEKERNANKKKQIEDVSKLRKQRVKSGFAGELDYDAAFEAMERGAPGAGGKAGQRGGPQGGFKDRGSPGGPKQGGPLNKKRMARDSKFGHGGSKRLSKQNDAVSAAAVDGFRQSRAGDDFGGRGRGGGRGGRQGGKPGGRPGAKGPGGKPGPGGPRKTQMKRPGKTARAGKRGGKR